MGASPLLTALTTAALVVEHTTSSQPLSALKSTQLTRPSLSGRSVSSVQLPPLLLCTTTIKPMILAPTPHLPPVVYASVIVPWSIFCTTQRPTTRTPMAAIVNQV